MKTNVNLYSLSDGRNSHYDVQLSSLCPCCGVHLSPDVLYGAIVEFNDEEDNKVFLLNYCPSCSECFISRHTFDSETDDGYILDSAAPMSYFEKSFSAEITDLSPDFVSIYNESLRAENMGLSSICGMGYRKALEFLVKDYIIHKTPSLKDEISSKMLMQCITGYINDERLKALARASTWLGNDATHYVKIHESYGINDLKTFVHAFVTFIDADLAYEKALNLIQS